MNTEQPIETTEGQKVNVDPLVSAFHAHLDVCQQCRDNPIELCRTGYFLLISCVGRSAPAEFNKTVDKEFWDLI